VPPAGRPSLRNECADPRSSALLQPWTPPAVRKTRSEAWGSARRTRNLMDRDTDSEATIELARLEATLTRSAFRDAVARRLASPGLACRAHGVGTERITRMHHAPTALCCTSKSLPLINFLQRHSLGQSGWDLRGRPEMRPDLRTCHASPGGSWVAALLGHRATRSLRSRRTRGTTLPVYEFVGISVRFEPRRLLRASRR
jgi:hypothetical protein